MSECKPRDILCMDFCNHSDLNHTTKGYCTVIGCPCSYQMRKTKEKEGST